MNRYEELGFFDFEDFVEELNEEELFSVNGGACGEGSINLPPQQICSNPSDYHCDIYAWNLAIKNGLDSRLGKSAEMDLNNQTVDTMYKSY